MKNSIEDLVRAERDMMYVYQLQWRKSESGYTSDIYKYEGYMLHNIDRNLKIFLSINKTLAEVEFSSKSGSFKFTMEVPCDDVAYAQSEVLCLINVLYDNL